MLFIVMRYTILCLFYTSAQLYGSVKQMTNRCTVRHFQSPLVYIRAEEEEEEEQQQQQNDGEELEDLS